VKQNYIEKNPILFMKKYKLDETKRRSLTSEEIEKIKVGSLEENIYPAVMTGYYTGMRKEEIMHLEWQDIDFEGNLIEVKNKKGQFRTKNRKNRLLMLHPALKEILLPLRQKQGYCFQRTNMRRAFDRIIRKAGIDVKNVKWHLFRHTAASTMLDRGASLSAVKDVLGHRDISTTAKYTHTLPNATKEAMSLL
jgi:integrase